MLSRHFLRSSLGSSEASTFLGERGGLTPHITGSKKHSEERAALIAVRVHVIVMCG